MILIAIGGLFLWNNLRPDVNIWNLIALYWPFFLIAWGLAQIVEIAACAAARRPLPRSIGNGEIVLVVFICLIGSLMYTSNRHGWHVGPNRLEMFGEQFDYPVSQQAAVSSARRVVFQNMRGNLRISGGDAAEIHISGRKTVRAFRRSEADQADRDTPVDIVTEGDQIVVRSNQDRISGDRRVSADLEIVLPRRLAVETHSRSGDTDISDVAADVDVSSDRGDVRISRVGGNARVALRRGDLIRAVELKGNLDLEGRASDVQLESVAGQVTINGQYSGTLSFKNLGRPLHFESPNTDLRVEALPGEINMDLSEFTARKIVGPIHLKTKSKDVKIEDFTQSLDLETERGDIAIDPGRVPLAKIDVRSKYGKIELALPDKAAFQLSATTQRGEAMNDFGPEIQKQSEGRASTLKGSVGSGPEISLSTGRGSVLVRKSGPTAPAQKADMAPEKF
jgi:DUF4097 and DUF4098 domain-containing protein YvlB